MWNITLADIHRAKGQLQARRAKLETKYLEDAKTLDADLAEIEMIEKLAASFAAKHQAAEGFDEANEEHADLAPAIAAADEPALAAEPSAATQGKFASRWRLHLDGRSGAEAEQ